MFQQFLNRLAHQNMHQFVLNRLVQHEHLLLLGNRGINPLIKDPWLDLIQVKTIRSVKLQFISRNNEVCLSMAQRFEKKGAWVLPDTGERIHAQSHLPGQWEDWMREEISLGHVTYREEHDNGQVFCLHESQLWCLSGAAELKECMWMGTLNLAHD